MITEEYVRAIKKERDEWKKKYEDLKKEFDSSDNSVAKNLREWIETNDTPELHADYPNHRFYIERMKKVLKGELH